MNRAKIGIIGAGNLGIRHLQALALLKETCQITVMDINREALRKAEIVFKGTQGAWKHEACFVSGIRFMISSIGITMRNLAITPQSSIICVRLKIILMMTAAAGLRLYLINSVMPSSL